MSRFHAQTMNVATTNDEVYNVIEFFARMWSRRMEVFVVGLLFVLVAILYTVFNPRPYLVSSTLRIDPGIPITQSASYIADVNIESEVSFLASRGIIRAAIEAVAAKNPALVETAMGSVGGWLSFLDSSVMSKDRFVFAIQKQMSVNAIGRRERSGLVQVSYNTHYPEFGRAFLEALTDLYRRQAYDRNARSKISALTKLKEEVKMVEADLQKAETALRDFQELNNTIDLDTETKISLQQLATLQNQLLTLQTKKQEQDTYYTDRFSPVKASKNQIAFLEQEIGRLQMRINGLPEVQRQLIKLKRDAEVEKSRHTAITDKSNQLYNEVVTINGFAQVTDPPEIMNTNTVKALIKNSVVSFVAGSLIGTVAIYFIYFSPLSRIRSHRQLRYITTLPLLGMLRPIKTSIMSLTAPPAERGHTLHRLKRNLDFATFGDENNIMLFTCDRGEEEAGLIASRIAAMYAETQKTVLIDCNMTRDAQNPYYRGTLEPGLSDIITKATALETSIQKLSIPNLWYLPCGEPTSFGDRLLNNPSFIKTLNLLVRVYDRVILNYPPITQRSDFGEACQLAGSVFLVVSSGDTTEYTKRLCQEFEGLPNVKGLIMRDQSGRRATSRV